jgi:hypothetical protein
VERLGKLLLAVPDAKAKVQMVLVHDNTAVGVVLIRGTHTGPL